MTIYLYHLIMSNDQDVGSYYVQAESMDSALAKVTAACPSNEWVMDKMGLLASTNNEVHHLVV